MTIGVGFQNQNTPSAAVKAAKTTVHGEGIRAWAPVGVSGIPATVAITVTGTALGPIEIEG
jgi:hypothetical protein